MTERTIWRGNGETLWPRGRAHLALRTGTPVTTRADRTRP